MDTQRLRAARRHVHTVPRAVVAQASHPATTLLPELASPWDPESRLEGTWDRATGANASASNFSQQ